MVKRRAQNAIAVVASILGRTVRGIGSRCPKGSPRRQASRAVSCSLAVSCSRQRCFGRSLHSICRRCRRQSAAACASMDEGTGRAVSQPALWSAVPIREERHPPASRSDADEYCGLVDDAMAKPAWDHYTECRLAMAACVRARKFSQRPARPAMVPRVKVNLRIGWLAASARSRRQNPCEPSAAIGPTPALCLTISVVPCRSTRRRHLAAEGGDAEPQRFNQSGPAI